MRRHSELPSVVLVGVTLVGVTPNGAGGERSSSRIPSGTSDVAPRLLLRLHAWVGVMGVVSMWQNP